jgi:hypothetical protein
VVGARASDSKQRFDPFLECIRSKRRVVASAAAQLWPLPPSQSCYRGAVLLVRAAPPVSAAAPMFPMLSAAPVMCRYWPSYSTARHRPAHIAAVKSRLPRSSLATSPGAEHDGRAGRRLARARVPQQQRFDGLPAGAGHQRREIRLQLRPAAGGGVGWGGVGRGGAGRGGAGRGGAGRGGVGVKTMI